MYTTWAFKSINNPLRDPNRSNAHALAVTVFFLADAIRKLRAVGSYEANAQQELTLWRGMKDLLLQEQFMLAGGSERAPMSTTSDLKVAAFYSASSDGLVFKIRTNSFLHRGVDLTFISAFPAEAEFLYPPLTFLRATGRKQEVELDEAKFVVVEVEPTI